MLNSLDLLIIVALVLIAASLLSLVLMFLVKNKTVKRICLYLVSALGIYLGYVGAYINWPGFGGQIAVGVIVALASIAAVVLELCSKGSESKNLVARIMAAAALVIGVANAFLI